MTSPLAPIVIPPEVRAQIYAHARATFPDECCGYLVGPAAEDAVDAVVACRNAQIDGVHPLVPERGPDTGFVIAGAELFAFARAFDTPRPPRIVYHSHPDGQATLSAIDRAMAAGPTYPVQHLVIAVRRTEVIEAAQFAWATAAHAFVEVARWRP